jgi:hypothetical protein
LRVDAQAQHIAIVVANRTLPLANGAAGFLALRNPPLIPRSIEPA